MNDLHELLEQKYFPKDDGRYLMGQIADDIINLLQADVNNYVDVTGFAKDFYLASPLAQDEKKVFYNELKKTLLSDLKYLFIF